MKKRAYPTILAISLLAILCLSSVHSASATQSFIDSADIEQYSDHANININFIAPINIDNVTPQSKGDLIQIQIHSASGEFADSERFDRTPWLASSQPQAYALYESIRFEQRTPNSGVVIIKLREPTEYTVYKSSDSRRVVITMLAQENQERDLPKATKTEPAPAADSLPDLEKSSKTVTSDTGSKKSLPAQVAKTSTAPTEIAQQATTALGTSTNLTTENKTLKTTTTEANDSSQATEPNSKLASLMEEARQAMATNDYSRAVQIYTKLLQQQDTIYSKKALEYLGVARERKGQKAHAKAIYEQYLEQYADGDDAIRVQQRLAGLHTEEQAPREKRRTVTQQQRTESEWTVFGGFSQYYRYADLTVDDDVTEGDDTDKIEASLTSDVYLSGRLRTENWDVRTRFSGGYINDFLEDSDGDEGRISDLYVAITSRNNGRAIRMGRQSSSTGGVLGRFDGLRAAFPLSEHMVLNVVTGYPVTTTTEVNVENDRVFYGANVDLGPYQSAWDFNAFIIEQKADSIVDRRAVGGEVRYFDSGRSLFSLLDYDIFHDDLNTFLLIGNWTTESNTTYSLTYDLRNSPILTTTNAMQGQLVDNVEDLLDTFTEDELKSIAEDRTADSEFINIGVSKPLTENLQIYSNFTVTNLSDMPASAGIDGLEGTGNEYSYDVQLLMNNLLAEGDTNIFALRYFDGSTSTRKTFSYDARYPITRNLRLNPRLRVDLRNNVNNDTDQWVLRPSFRMNYRWNRRYHIELELGGEWSTRELTDDIDEDTQGFFGTLGYRVDF